MMNWISEVDDFILMLRKTRNSSLLRAVLP